jgi:hypothetical protein
MMKIPVFILLIVFVSGALSLFAEDKSVSQRIIGIWKIDSFTQNDKVGEMRGVSVWLEFLSGGTGRAVSQDPKGKREIKQITWSVDGNVLSIIEEGKTDPEKPAIVSFDAKGSKCTLNIKDDNIIMHASRVRKSSIDDSIGSEGQSVAPQIVGTWKLESFKRRGEKKDLRGDKIWMEFFSDGIGRVLRLSAKGDKELKNIRWVVSGNVLSITDEGKDEPEKPIIVTVKKGGKSLSMSKDGDDIEMYLVRVPGSIPGIPKRTEGTAAGNDDASIKNRLAGIWRLEESDGVKVDSERWYDLHSDGKCRLVEGSGGSARVVKKGTWVVKGNMLSLRDEGETEGDDASFILTDGDSKLELKAKSSDSVLHLVRETGELPPVDESEDEKSK